MIDIHCHLLYGVDDGADTIALSEDMLHDAASMGITDMILTPHYRKGMFSWNRKKISEHFRQVAAAASDAGIRISIGCEYHADADMIYNLKEGHVPTLAGSEYVLTEFGYESTCEHMRNTVSELTAAGYVPVIAHAERYRAIQKDLHIALQLREMGGRIQLNAGGILGHEGRVEKSTCKKLLQDLLVDFVASDSHDMGKRRNRMYECMRYIEKRYGEDIARKLFETNPGMMITGSGDHIG